MPHTNEADQERFEALSRSLGDMGQFHRGSVVRRWVPCGKPNCACQADPPRLRGPYYPWTRKIRGKTVTERLTEQETKLLQGWIANSRQIDKALATRERLSLRLTEQLLGAARKD